MPYHINIDEFPDCIREFANYKRAIQGCSAKTVEEYLTDLRLFTKYLCLTEAGLDPTEDTLAETSIKDVNLELFERVKPSQITEYLSYSMDARCNNERTRSRKLSSIKAFYRYYVNKVHKLEKSPAVDIETPKYKKSLPKFLTVDESTALLAAVDRDVASKTRNRDYCMLTLFLNCGIRLSELCGISERDIDPDITEMRILGKGNKERLIYLNDACKAAITAYLPERREYLAKCKDPAKPLFISNQGKRISPKTVQYTVKKYLDESGLRAKGYSTHKLRHTAATLMYRTGEVDIRVLKDILGHEQLTTTQIYTHVSDEGMRKAMAKNPLAKERSTAGVKATSLQNEDTE